MPKVSKQSPSFHLYNCDATSCSLRRSKQSVSESDILSDLRFKRLDANHHMSPHNRKVSFESCSSSHSSSLASASDASLPQDPFKRSLLDATQEERTSISSSSCEIQKPRLSRSFCLQSLVDAADDSNILQQQQQQQQQPASYHDAAVRIQPPQPLSSRRRRLRAESVSLPISAARTSSPPCSSWGHFVDVIPIDHDDVPLSTSFGWKSPSRSLSRYSPYSPYCLAPSKKVGHAKSFKTNANEDGISAALRKIQI